MAFWYQSLLVAPTGIWWHCGCSFKDLMGDELGNEIRMLLGDRNGMPKPPSELGFWNAFAKIYDIKGGSFYCSFLDTALVPYERLYDFKLEFEDPSPSACAAFTSETSPPSLGLCLDTRSLCQASNAETICWHIWASGKMFVIGLAMVRGALADEFLTLMWPLVHGFKPCCHPG